MIERGTKIGRFVVIAELGSGGMGSVYAAHDPELDRQVALKVMRGAADDEEDRVRMLREGQAMARVTHPNVITVYEVGTSEGIVFLAQELLDGGTLGEWLEKPRTRDEIIEKFIAAGRGLAAAHAAGLVHRDFKPDNVLLGKDGRVRVADFGLARAVGAAGLATEALAATTRGGGPPHDDDPVTTSPMSPLTRTGAVMGTPMYMAPEQHNGERADARSDQFGFCVALYHALYNRWPFAGKTSVALADAVIAGRLEPPPKKTTVPSSLHQILARGLSTSPAARFSSMDALLGALEPRPARRRGAVPYVIGGVMLAGAAVAGVYAMQRDRSEQRTVRAPLDASPQPVDIQGLTGDNGGTWLTAAIDRGLLDDAITKYDLAGLAVRGQGGINAALVAAGGAYVLALRGDLRQAEIKLGQASGHAGSDPLAGAHVDLAAAAVAAARGNLAVARERSGRCAKYFETTAPLMAAFCYQVLGDATADAGDAAAARAAYDRGLAIARRQGSAERTSTLELALAQLDLDAQHRDRAAASAAAIQAACADRAALGCEVNARVLLARARLDDGESQQALELIVSVKAAAIEAVRIRIAHAIALGEVHGYLHEAGDDEVTGLQRIESARAEAERRGFTELVFEARLARTRVLLATGQDDAQGQYSALLEDARAKGFERIARLAEANFAEIASSPQDMLPGDGGLPAVRP